MYSFIGAPSQITAVRCNSSAALGMAPVAPGFAPRRGKPRFDCHGKHAKLTDGGCQHAHLHGQLEPRHILNSVGALFFSWRRADARWMSRYFFILVYPDRIIGDARGTVLPSDEAAVGAARTIIDDLLGDSGPGQPRPIIMVRNEAGELIYQFPTIESQAMPQRRFPPPWTLGA